MNCKNKGFTLLEVLAVVVIIAILSALGWASMHELIQTNKAKEAARALTAFAERAVAEGKMRKDSITISVSGVNMDARLASDKTSLPLFSQVLSGNFSTNTAPANANPRPDDCTKLFTTVTSVVKIGISGVTDDGCFVVCASGGNYCASAVKEETKNTFVAYIKRKNSGWEAL